MHTNYHSREMYLFDSMQDVQQYCDRNLMFTGEMAGQQDAKWVGRNLPSYDAMINAIDSQWEVGLTAITQFVEQLEKEAVPDVKSHVRRVKFNDHDGDEIDLDRLRNGQDFWRASVREESTGQTTITIVAETAASANRNSLDLLWRGAAAVALTKILEAKGYQVELWAAAGGYVFGDNGIMTATCLKRCSDPLDVSSLVNAISGWCFRSSTFLLYESIAKKTGRKCAWGYGRPLECKAADLQAITTDERRIHSASVFSFHDALRMIRAELAKFAPV